MMHIMSSMKDLRNWVDDATSGWCERTDQDVEDITDAIHDMDHPDWGTDWTTFFEQLPDLTEFCDMSEEEEEPKEFILLGAGRQRMQVTSNGIGFDGPKGTKTWNPDTIWQESACYGVVARDALTVVADPEKADEVQSILEDYYGGWSNRRKVYWVDGTQGFVVHEIHQEEE